MSFSQDVHFSQRFAAFSFFNDNYGLQANEKLAAYSIYREQWGVLGRPLTTTGLGFLAPLRQLGPINLKLGVQVLSDLSGDARLKSDQFTINVLTDYELGNNLFGLSLGNGMVMRSFDAGQLSFPSQYDRNIGGFNTDLPNYEDLSNQQQSYFKLNLALYWLRKLSNRMQVETGLSLRQLNQPEINFLSSADQLKTGLGVQSILSYNLNTRWIVKPSVSYYRLQKASETVFGGSLKRMLSPQSKVKSIEPFLYSRLGVSRNVDALILGSNISWAAFTLGLSYDVNVSGLQVATNNQGAFELSLRYALEKRSITHKKIPCERY